MTPALFLNKSPNILLANKSTYTVLMISNGTLLKSIYSYIAAGLNASEKFSMESVHPMKQVHCIRSVKLPLEKLTGKLIVLQIHCTWLVHECSYVLAQDNKRLL